LLRSVAAAMNANRYSVEKSVRIAVIIAVAMLSWFRELWNLLDDIYRVRRF